MKYEIFLNTAFHYGSDNAETIINKYFDSKKKAYEYIEMCSGVFVEEVQ